MELLEDVIALFLLKEANMSEDSEKLTMTTVTRKYKDMREKILKTFGVPSLHAASQEWTDSKRESFVWAEF